MRRLRICLVGSFTGPTDEGMRNVAEAVSQELSEHHRVLKLSPGEMILKCGRLRAFDPDIIHYLSGPTIASILLLSFSRWLNPSAKTFVTATHPWLYGVDALPRRIRPDFVFVQSKRQAARMKGVFNSIGFAPNGVDSTRFQPVMPDDKTRVRNALKIPEDSFVVLHVGNLRKGRNLEVLKRLAGNAQYTVVLVASTSVKTDSISLKRSLEANGVIVIDEFLPRIEEIYACSDCYVFPTEETGRAIEIPLSVLEAIASNLPVVATRFGGLPDLFENSKWIRMVQNPFDIPKVIEEIRQLLSAGTSACDTRTLAEGLSWSQVASIICCKYVESMTEE